MTESDEVDIAYTLPAIKYIIFNEDLDSAVRKEKQLNDEIKKIAEIFGFHYADVHLKGWGISIEFSK